MARQRQYLPHVLEAVGGRSVANCVDIGCGRGEWLELLAGQGIRAVGIDLDPGMAREAQHAGLDARTGDGIEWLERQPPDSVDVVTAFHVIEHLPFDRLLRLLDAALQALAPGGVAIFETPNPENLLVATNSFHLDPTHRHPIPPPLAEFLAQQRGFGRTELLRLNPLPAQMRVPGDDELTRRVNQLLYGAQDYALVAWKQGAAVRTH
jgi:O-antigen chain-terminating methyltransferase